MRLISIILFSTIIITGCSSKKGNDDTTVAASDKTAISVCMNNFMQNWQREDYGAMLTLMAPELRSQTTVEKFSGPFSTYILESFEIRALRSVPGSSRRVFVDVHRVLRSRDGRLTDRDVNTFTVESIDGAWFISK